MFPLFESIKIENGVPRNLPWHQERIAVSFRKYFNSGTAPELKKIIRVPGAYEKGTVKCRFLYDNQSWSLEFSAYSPVKIETLQLTEADSLDYSLKYSDRSAIDQLVMRKGNCDDILMVKNGMICDTSFANVVFFDG